MQSTGLAGMAKCPLIKCAKKSPILDGLDLHPKWVRIEISLLNER